ncbi:putative ABC transporter permease protein [Lentibacillus sp. JNUCC-1]|uniref:carbohydrate ABC transporter permease n=1 Tax=Lentibacillus sp. JNUCC-1 TaxID=2654513 RepID=UPI001328CB70|nr:sugar ABC transporter permease [Lentibacillus sp. JNUCC-1]MUV37043.1 putative ABC transporter permease protein [Lentibacillus sp. JNUCC-1]
MAKSSKKGQMTLKRRRTLIAYGFLLVPILFYLGVRIVPAVQALSMSFTYEGSSVFTLDHYKELMKDKVFWISVRNTIYYVLLIVPLQMAFGLLIALAIERVDRFKWFYRIVFFLPYMTSIVAVSWVWRLIYEPNTGILNQILDALNIPGQGWLTHPDTALISVSVVIIWQMMGFCMLIFTAGLQVIPRQYYEAAEIDGAGRWKKFWMITFPLLNPTIVFLAIIGVIQTLQTFTQIANLTGGATGGGLGGPLNSTASVVVYMYNQGFRDYNLHFAAASTVFLFILILIVTLIQFRVLNKSYKF